MKNIFLVSLLVLGIFGSVLANAEDVVLVDRIGKDSSNTDGTAGYTNDCSGKSCMADYTVTPVKVSASKNTILSGFEMVVQGTSKNNYCEAGWNRFAYKYMVWKDLKDAIASPIKGTLAHSDDNQPKEGPSKFGTDIEDCSTFLLSFDLSPLKYTIKAGEAVYVAVLPVVSDREGGIMFTIESWSKRSDDGDVHLVYDTEEGYRMTANYENNQADGLYGIRVTGTEVGNSLLGDTNCDSSVDFDDIDPFIVALIDEGQFRSEYPNCDVYNADVNQDNLIDFSDIDSFVEKLIG